VTYYTAFVIELHTRRVAVLGSTPNPDGAFVVQAVRSLLGETDAVLRERRILLCDRDPTGPRRWRPCSARVPTYFFRDGEPISQFSASNGVLLDKSSRGMDEPISKIVQGGEPNLDVAFKAGGKVYLRSRNDHDFSGRYGGVLRGLAGVPPETVVDGEIVGTNG
jgi:hypothetical protein